MTQQVFWHDSIYEALQADVAASGGVKVVAGKLFPNTANAETKLRNLLNRDQPHTPCPETVLAIKKIAREAGSTYTIDFEAQLQGYQVVWTDPKEEVEELRRENNELLKRVIKNQERLERAEDRALKVVR